MKILRFALLLVMICLVGCSALAPPPVAIQPTKAEATYAKCQEIERYYLIEQQESIPDVLEPNSIAEPLFASGQGYFWNRPNDLLFLPPEEVNAPPALGLAQAGSYLSPRQITCDLQEGQIRVDMKAFIELAGQARPLELNQVDELWWDNSSGHFKGRISIATLDNKIFVQNDGDFFFLNCDVKGSTCQILDVLIPFLLPGGPACAQFTEANYGLQLDKSQEIQECTMYIDNLTVFQDNPQQVVVFEEDRQKILGPHIQAVNDVWLEVAYQDNSVLKYSGADCFMQYTTNSQQDWDNPGFDRKLCSAKNVISMSRSTS